MANNTIEFYGELRDETDAAYLIHDGINKVWLPKSQVKNKRQISGHDFEFEIPEWLAKKKGII
jgi:hypothetical protein